MNEAPRVGDVIQAEQDVVARELLAEFGGPETESGLRLTGLEIAAFLAVKVALPIVTGFVGREVWERYNRIRSRNEAARATADVEGERLQRLQVQSDDLIDRAVIALTDEGVPDDVAHRIAQQCFERVRDRADSRS